MADMPGVKARTCPYGVGSEKPIRRSASAAPIVSWRIASSGTISSCGPSAVWGPQRHEAEARLRGDRFEPMQSAVRELDLDHRLHAVLGGKRLDPPVDPAHELPRPDPPFRVSRAPTRHRLYGAYRSAGGSSRAWTITSVFVGRVSAT